ncbi:uncharacterized protein LOC115905535 [Camarhynchus parvulus]|uniref:uncharacterized protein LOC115905535 n=1 Tax=Geospiza parvula TaxID=87175 RepID=UPI001237E3A3|nr:uncharacterized protein LOC115905535 [Camarhynchus parvulus]
MSLGFDTWNLPPLDFGMTKPSSFSRASPGIGWEEQSSVEYGLDWFLRFLRRILHPLVKEMLLLLHPGLPPGAGFVRSFGGARESRANVPTCVFTRGIAGCPREATPPCCGKQPLGVTSTWREEKSLGKSVFEGVQGAAWEMSVLLGWMKQEKPMEEIENVIFDETNCCLTPVDKCLLQSTFQELFSPQFGISKCLLLVPQEHHQCSAGELEENLE